MTPLFQDPLVQLALPALLAGVVAILATLAVERFGGGLGGILSTIPSTIVPAAIGMYGDQSNTDDFRRTMAFIPIGILLNAGYLVLWRIVPAMVARRTHSHLLAWTVALSLSAWLIAATVIMLLHEAFQPTVTQSLAIGCLASFAGLVVGIAASRTPHPTPRGHHGVSRRVLLVRGTAAAIAIGVALVLARLGLPVASGLASVFPAIFTTILVATWIAQGAHVTTGAVGPMALGTLSISAFALLAALLFPLMNLALAATLAWTIAVACVSVPAYLFLGHRRRRAQLQHIAPSPHGSDRQRVEQRQ